VVLAFRGMAFGKRSHVDPEGVNGVQVRRRWLDPVGAGSLVAFALSGLATLVVLALIASSDNSEIRWWVVVVPLLATATALVITRPGSRIAALGVLVVWCVLTATSVGFLFLPAVVALFLAVRADRGRRPQT
jgi:hypothetical protein